jgi:hypothetical protein
MKLIITSLPPNWMHDSLELLRGRGILHTAYGRGTGMRTYRGGSLGFLLYAMRHHCSLVPGVCFEQFCWRHVDRDTVKMPEDTECRKVIKDGKSKIHSGTIDEFFLKLTSSVHFLDSPKNQSQG